MLRPVDLKDRMTGQEDSFRVNPCRGGFKSVTQISEMVHLRLRRTDKDVVLEGEVIYLLRDVVAIEHKP